MCRVRLPLILLLLLISCKHDGPTVVYEPMRMTDSIAADPLADSMIAPYRDSLLLTMETVLVQNEQPLTRGIPESTLGNLIADLLLERAQLEMPSKGKVDLCLINIGGLRVDLPEGNITTGKVFELMPFDNELDILRLSPERMREMFDYLNKAGGQPVSGMRLQIDEKRYTCTINGLPWHPDSTYYIVTSDYLADGGDRMDFFAEPLERIPTGIRIRDAIIDHFRTLGLAGSSLSAQLDGRLTIE